MMELPLWPPLLFLAIGAVGMLWLRHESHKLDRETERRQQLDGSEEAR